MTVGERIKARREELNMSQDELAKRVGYTSRTTINKIERGFNNLRQTKISEFAKALSCSPSDLMGWKDEPINIFANDLFSDIPLVPAENMEGIRRNISHEEAKEMIELYKKYIKASKKTQNTINFMLNDEEE